MSELNIVEAYIKYRGQLVIIVSGMSGCGKTIMAKNISDAFKIKHLMQINYYKDGYDQTATLPDGTSFINYHTDDAIDWDKMNRCVNEHKKDGIVISGTSFPRDRLNFETDLHIHISAPKDHCIAKRQKYLEMYKNRFPKEFDEINTPIEKLKVNQIIYPYYLESKKKMNIDNYINIGDISEDELWDKLWDDVLFKSLFTKENVDKYYHEYTKQ